MSSKFLEGADLRVPQVFKVPRFSDDRGSFAETIRFPDNWSFVQANESRSCEKAVRGLHYQEIRPTGKLVRVVCGSIIDVAVSMSSVIEPFGTGHAFTLHESNDHIEWVWIPPTHAHGFAVVSKNAIVEYFCTASWNPDGENHVSPRSEVTSWKTNPSSGLLFTKAANMMDAVISEKDKKSPLLRDWKSKLKP